jgi:hypothetical protein
VASKSKGKDKGKNNIKMATKWEWHCFSRQCSRAVSKKTPVKCSHIKKLKPEAARSMAGDAGPCCEGWGHRIPSFEVKEDLEQERYL